jgi:mannose-1-phosphate guanylyltransferase
MNNIGGKHMKALFLAGGMGTRLKPLTNEVPKPMIPIMAKPILERNMLKLKDCGVDEIILSTGYKSQVIEDHFGYGEKWGLKIHYVCEESPLGTGGAIKNAESFFQETFLVFNADIFCDIDIKEMMEFHKKMKSAVTIAVTQVANPSAFGVIEYDDNLYAKSFIEKPEPSEIKSNYINAGIYLFEPEVLKNIPGKKVVSIERETFPQLLKRGLKIAVFKSDAYWMDVGTIKKYIQVQQDILKGICEIPEYKDSNQHVYIGANPNIHPSVQIISPVYIGNHVSIGENSVIGPNSIIGDNCRVAANKTIAEAIIWDNISIQNDSIFLNIIYDSVFLIFENLNKNMRDTEPSDEYITI